MDVSDIRVTSSNKSAWLNGPTHCIARFTEKGYEIFSANIRESEPLATYLTNIPASLYVWFRFKDAVKAAHGVVLGDDQAPGYLRPMLGVA